MSLPDLPKTSNIKYMSMNQDGTKNAVAYAYTEDQLRKYGQACRAAALEEAAQVCNGEQWHNSARPVDYIEAYNEGCADCEAAIRRLK